MELSCYVYVGVGLSCYVMLSCIMISVATLDVLTYRGGEGGVEQTVLLGHSDHAHGRTELSLVDLAISILINITPIMCTYNMRVHG